MWYSEVCQITWNGFKSFKKGVRVTSLPHKLVKFFGISKQSYMLGKKASSNIAMISFGFNKLI